MMGILKKRQKKQRVSAIVKGQKTIAQMRQWRDDSIEAIKNKGDSIILPSFFMRCLLFGMPILFALTICLKSISAFTVHGAYLERLRTNTPCFINEHDFLLLQTLQNHTHTTVFNILIDNLNKIGLNGFMSVYLGILSSVLIIQLLLILYKALVVRHSLSQVKPYSKGQIMTAILMSLVFFGFLYSIGKKINVLDVVQKQQIADYQRFIAYKSDKLEIDKDVSQQCIFSNKIHLIPANQKSYIGLN